MTFDDGTVCKPAKLEIIKTSLEKSSAYISIAEGKFHQVKKMFLAYGVKVIYLQRMTFGDFELGDLPRGQYRELNTRETEILKKYLD